MELPPHRCIPAGSSLELDLTLNCFVRFPALGVEEGRAMISLDDRNRAVRFEHSMQLAERGFTGRKVLEDKAKEEMVERLPAEGKMQNIGDAETDICGAGSTHALLCLNN